MSRLFLAIRKAWALLRIRLIEIHLDDLNKAMRKVRDEETRIYLALQRRVTQRELVHARIKYNDLLPPGERHVWTIA